MKAALGLAGHFARLRRRLASVILALPLLLTVPAGADETLSYDANGNVETRSLPGGTTTYSYDDLNRVSSEAGPAKTQNLSYDPNGNRTGDASGTHSYAGSSDRQLTIAGQSLSLDAAGNVTQARGLNFTWNQAGQLKTVSQGATLLATYTYDYQGRRSRKVKEGMSSLSYRTTLYVYDLYDRLISELNGAGSPLRTYVWRDDIPVALIVHGSETVLYLETDHLHTPIAARNQAGTVVWKWESDAFGSTPANEDPDGDGSATTINLRFPGQYYDKESGLHYNHHRYYDPRLGRYLSPDPIGLAGGPNLYGYVGENPLSWVDPLGLDYGFSVDPAAAGGNGHATLYFQNNGGDWFAFNQGAAGKTSSGGDLGFLTGSNAPAGVSIESIPAPPSGALIYPSSEQENGKIASCAVVSQKTHNSGKKKYNLYGNNCKDSAVGVLACAGITVPNPILTIRPNSWIKALPQPPARQ